MIIAQISDTHIALDLPDAALRIEDFERVVADINALDPAPDVVIHTGDIVYNGRLDEYAAARAVLERLKVPVHLMVGNKDNRENLRAAFPQHEYLSADSKFVSYALEEHPVTILALDTLDPESNKGDFCAARLAKLAELIDADATKPVAVFMHHPPFEIPVGPDPLNFGSHHIIQSLNDVLQESGRVIAIVCGHVHRPTWGNVGDIPATVMSAVATGLRREDYPDNMMGNPVYNIYRHDPDYGFSVEARIVS